VEFPVQSTICTALTRLSRLLPIKYVPRAMLFTISREPDEPNPLPNPSAWQRRN
jgi:hypothetical protein